ncbi:MAG: O-acetyl-ADP-ribose deacetylase [Caldisphaera sp.]|jgi:O-acetyl-ADP-ribose deacetylase (regulator of RNase III)|nr:macro domain-containing protein [Caldisphaera sp.]PMP91764.1 MAG: O-acetyl-ADP-ribose deacetylase [Caldisphaera sp.]
MHIYKINGTNVIIKKGDIAQEEIEAIVNPANSFLLMGGGLAGILKRKGGNVIEQEALKHAPIDIGNAVITTAGRLKATYVIHSPTMKYPGEITNEDNVRLAVRAALNEGKKHDVKSIAFPGMGTGVGGVPYSVAAKAMLEEIKKFIEKEDFYEKVVIVAYDDAFYDELEKAASFII